MKTIDHTAKTKSVKLTASEWNKVLIALSEARRWNEDHNYPTSARRTYELQDTIRALVGDFIETQFNKEFPPETHNIVTAI
jgi:hypothetical protein